jgi:high affinity Mn2+ porin
MRLDFYARKTRVRFIFLVLGEIAIFVSSRPAQAQDQSEWNFHVQNTDVVQGDPGFPAKYSGPNSLSSRSQIQQTMTVDVYSGLRLWPGAEAHVDGLMWQGFGLSKTFGIEDFPNGDAFKAGTVVPNGTLSHLFIRQTIGLGGEKEDVSDGRFTLAGKQDIRRLTITLGRFTPEDMLDQSSYGGDMHTQFMNWGLMANPTFDYGQDTVGYSTGIAIELNQPRWALRYTLFQMPDMKNGFTGEDQYLAWPARGKYGPFLKSWAMAAELERRYAFGHHPGTVRLLEWVDQANFVNYGVATEYLLANPPGPNAPSGSGADIPDSLRSYQLKYGFGLNWEQEVGQNVGVFSRLGWNDGQQDAWTFTDINYTASLGLSVRGKPWHRPHDTFGLGGVLSGASRANRRFLEAGGEDIIDGDGKLNYGWEKVVETYYDAAIWKTVHVAVDYQFILDPAFNRDRGPVSVFGLRLRWQL